MQERLSKLEELTSRLLEANEKLTERVITLEKTVNVTTTYIGFSAHRNDGSDVAHNERIVFEHVTTNLGGGYDPTTGIFTCPISGYYFVSVTTFSQVITKIFFIFALGLSKRPSGIVQTRVIGT